MKLKPHAYSQEPIPLDSFFILFVTLYRHLFVQLFFL
jgi:hypothetical protein